MVGYYVIMLMIFSFKMPWRYVEQVAAPNMALKMLDMATQVHGGAGVSSDTVLAHLWATARTLRIADGPNFVLIFSLKDFGLVIEFDGNVILLGVSVGN